ncbi:MAG: hypothetical protein ACXQTG_02150 [Methanoculleaceae archaeon]
MDHIGRIFGRPSFDPVKHEYHLHLSNDALPLILPYITRGAAGS